MEHREQIRNAIRLSTLRGYQQGGNHLFWVYMGSLIVTYLAVDALKAPLWAAVVLTVLTTRILRDVLRSRFERSLNRMLDEV